MKNLTWIFLSLITILSCNNKNVVIPEAEIWEATLSEITDEVLDARVNGNEFHLITEKFFYRLQGESILEKRPLVHTHYRNYSSPILGKDLIFRLINFDSVAYLEFQPIKPGGNVMRISYDELGDDKLAFPITHGFGGRHTGRFDDQNNFLFVGFDSPSLQQFISRIRISYDSFSNIIYEVNITERSNLNPTGPDWSSLKARDIWVADGIFFLDFGYGGSYRYAPGALDYYPQISLESIIADGTDLIAVNSSREIISSSDMGISWTPTPWNLDMGCKLSKEGDFYIATNEYDQIFKVGENISELLPFSFPPFDETPFSFATIRYYNNYYFLFCKIDGQNKIFKRSSLH